ncbi:hypothetical protein SAMN05216548_114111 [Faunimonas pinastri]|uniref:Uncharacterized protein n=1 Tax=Faunimonas pinastri TaxID=1855383 RepID=A0A1H9MZ76_9HYPH|nr:hypothetical protein [Faunimonas pinastri]SER28827.1 hypothetical protein SAMN05216548_114111 [Faunimonas pinastri]
MTCGKERPLGAPGCYGSALTFKAEAAECKTCVFAANCGPLSAANMAYVRAKLGIVERKTKTAMRAERPKKLDPAPAIQLTSNLPKKVEELLARFERAGIKVTERLSAGENPFEKTPVFMRVACHLLLRLPSGFDRNMLRQALQSKLGWSSATAASHAIQACQALVALGAAEEMNGRLTLKRG